MAASGAMIWSVTTVLSFALISLVNGRCRHDSECYNGGRCDLQGLCVCAEGYKGSSCKERECVPSCKNGGTCTASGVCTCEPHYYGSSCQYSSSSGGSLGSSAKYIPGAVFGGGLLVCVCISILIFWLRIRKRQRGSGHRPYSSVRQHRRHRRSTVQTSRSQRRSSTSAASGRRPIVAPQPSPFANPNAPPPYTLCAGTPSSHPPPYTAVSTTDSQQYLPHALQLPHPLPYADEPPAYLLPPAYDSECHNNH